MLSWWFRSLAGKKSSNLDVLNVVDNGQRIVTPLNNRRYINNFIYLSIYNAGNIESVYAQSRRPATQPSFFHTDSA